MELESGFGGRLWSIKKGFIIPEINPDNMGKVSGSPRFGSSKLKFGKYNEWPNKGEQLREIFDLN